MPLHRYISAAIASLAVLSAATACGAPETSVSVGERTYLVPPGHIVSQTMDPHTFIRIKHPDAPFELIYDSRSEHKRDEQGRPLIFGLNDENVPDIHYYRTIDRVVVCRRAVHPNGGCGTKVNYGGANWSIVYPDGRLEETETLVRHASTLLKEYDRHGR